MKNGHLLSLACLLAIFGPSAGADVMINFNVDSVYTAQGDPVPTSGLGLIIADTTGDGFGPIQAGSIETGSFLGSSDLIIYRADFSMFGTDGVWSESVSLPLSDTWAAGSSLAFVWFPDLTGQSLSIRSGDSYGMATHAGWITPADGATVTYQIISSSGLDQGLFEDREGFVTLQLPDGSFGASLSVVPELSSHAAIASPIVVIAAFAGRWIFRRRMHSGPKNTILVNQQAFLPFFS